MHIEKLPCKPSDLKEGESMTVTFPSFEGKPAPVKAIFERDYGQLLLRFVPSSDKKKPHPAIPFIVFDRSSPGCAEESVADSQLENWLYPESWESWASKEDPVPKVVIHRHGQTVHFAFTTEDVDWNEVEPTEEGHHVVPDVTQAETQIKSYIDDDESHVVILRKKDHQRVALWSSVGDDGTLYNILAEPWENPGDCDQFTDWNEAFERLKELLQN